MKATNFFTNLILSATVGASAPAHGASTTTLPKGIVGASVRVGYVANIDQAYSDGGQLANVGDTKSITFSAENLSKVNSEAQNLINALNAIGSQNLGSQINLGTLRVETHAIMTYTAPVLAYGLTKRWTIAGALPVIQYVNDVRLRSEGSNVDAYRRLNLTGFSQQLDRALNIDLVSEVGKLMAQKGYKPFKSRNETFIADTKVGALYQLARSKKFEALYQFTITLPTGPAYDPDDLLAPNRYGRSGIENGITLGFKLSQSFVLTPYGSVLYYLPDQVQARVPASEDDVLPGLEQKQTVNRQLGLMTSAGTDLNWLMNSSWTSMIGAEASRKNTDSFGGTDSRMRYELLSRNTEEQIFAVKAGISYSTVSAFKKKQSVIPGIVGLDYSDIIAGKNKARETVSQLTLMVFF